MKVKVTQLGPTLCDLTDYTVHGILQAPSLQVDSLPAKPQGKPKNTGVGGLSLLQWIFPTQESNRGLLHCRWILHQLSYQGSAPLEIRAAIINRMCGSRLHPTPKIYSVRPLFLSPLEGRYLFWNKCTHLFCCVLSTFEPTLS